MAYKTVDEARSVLADTTATWVDRRDAADTLLSLARQATAALQTHRDDSDRDVSLAVQSALKRLDAPSELLEPMSMGELVMASAKPGSREVSKDDQGYKVEVTLKNKRTQTVFVQEHQRTEKVKIVRVYTLCGPPKDEACRGALEANAKLVQSAVARIDHEGTKQFALIQCFLDGYITKTEMHASIKEVAFYGDWLEGKMTGLDKL